MARKTTWVIFWMLMLLSMVVILRFPLNKYEWMLDDPTLAGADIQLPTDHSASMYPYFAGVPALFLFVFYYFAKARKERMIVLSAIGLLFVTWLIRFRSLIFGA